MSELVAYRGGYAIAGGLAASFYRTKPRVTNDVDIAFAIGTYEESKQAAIHVIESIGYDAALGWIYAGEKKKLKRAPMIIGRHDQNNLEGTIDFLLPSFPWVETAVLRAQDHLIDFGFAKIPTVTLEDLIIAKAFALDVEPNRFQDLDDIKSILLSDNEVDFSYVVSQCERLDLAFPSALESFLPAALRKL